MKVLSILLHFIVILKMTQIISAEYIFTNKFTKITCNSSGKTCVVPFCYVTTDNQSFSSVSYGCNYNRLVGDTNLTLKVFYKYQNGYRQIVKIPTVNWNKVVGGKNLNPFFKIIVGLLYKTSPSEFAIASPKDTYGVYNLSVENGKYFSMFPKGDYKFEFFFGDKLDDFIFGAKVFNLLSSSMQLDESL